MQFGEIIRLQFGEIIRLQFGVMRFGFGFGFGFGWWVGEGVALVMGCR